METQNQKLHSSTTVFTSVPIEVLAELIFSKLCEKYPPNIGVEPDITNDIVLFEKVMQAFNKSRPSIGKYMKQNIIRSHYFDSNSPVFLRSELLEDIRRLPDHNAIYGRLSSNQDIE